MPDNPYTPNGAPPVSTGGTVVVRNGGTTTVKPAEQAAQWETGQAVFSEPAPRPTIPTPVNTGSGVMYIERPNPAYAAWVERKNAFERRQAANRDTAGQKPINDQLQGVVTQTQKPEDSQFKEYQARLAAQLERQSRGEGPSLVEMMLNRQRDQAIAAQRSQAASARPDMAGTAGIAAAHNIGKIGLDVANQAAIGKLQEQQAAQQALAQLVTQGRGGDQSYLQTMLNARLGALQGQANLYGMNLQNQQFQQQLAQAIQLARMGQPSTLERLLGAGAGLLPMMLGIG